MSRQQVSVVLDAELPLDQREGQITHLGHRAAHQTVHGHHGSRRIHPGKVPQQQTVQHQKQAAAQDTADIALQGLVGADPGDAPVLTQKHPGKIGPRIGEEGADHRQQHQIPAVLHPLQPHQAGEEYGDAHPGKQAHQHILEGHSVLAVVQADGHHEQGHHQGRGRR